MIDLNSKDYTYANLNILKIKRMIAESEFKANEFKSNEIVNIALDVLRILCEIPFGNGSEDEYNWELFFNARKSRDGVIHMMNYFKRVDYGKNSILNEVFDNVREEDIEKLLKEINEE